MAAYKQILGWRNPGRQQKEAAPYWGVAYETSKHSEIIPPSRPHLLMVPILLC